MLKASEILLETIKKDGRPERLLRQYEGATFYPPNPANNYVRGCNATCNRGQQGH